jgi:3-hydroxyacyl-[acyl-carrier-protein] dehydratase
MLPKPIDILPQQPPFLFVDEYLEVDENHCLAKYAIKNDEWFFAGHFPGNPVVPGVILIEAIGQAGAGIGIFIIAKNKELPLRKIKEKSLVVFTYIGDIEFLEMVRPGDTIFISCRKKFFRFNKLEVSAEIYKIVNKERRVVCRSKSMVGHKTTIKGG